MPFRRRTTRRSRRRTFAAGASKRRRAALARRRRAPRRVRRLPLTGFPSKKLIRLRYTHSLNLDGGASGAVAKATFRLNGMFQPLNTATTHQPLGFDQWMTIYDHFTVLGSKINVKVSPVLAEASLINTIPGAYGIIVDDNATIDYLTAEQIIESKQGGQVKYFGYPSTNSRTNQVTKKFSAKKFFGNSAIVGKSLYRGTSAADPSEGAFAHVWAAGMGGSDPGNVLVTVTIEYIAMLTEPKFLAQS